MRSRFITTEIIEKFRLYLLDEEKSNNTIEKYLRDVTALANFCQSTAITKEVIIAYKEKLIEDNYSIPSINSMLAGINSLFCFMGWHDLRVRNIKFQRQMFYPKERELTRKDYERLCKAALRDKNERLHLILQTICATGIRVSELKFITVESVRKGKALVSLKGKCRYIFIVRELQKKLLRYAAKQGIEVGSVFITRTGKPISRSTVWREMKSLCSIAKVDSKKVFPHNLRRLFAREFYQVRKDISKLADILGHSSINTTRIYLMGSGKEHLLYMENMCLVI